MSLSNEIKNDAAGYQILQDWFGDGLRPVTQEQADKRAVACMQGNNGGECPHLTWPKWWETAKGAIASAIKEQLEAKSKMKLETAIDKAPRMCSGCGCCMSLKVWAPISHIAAHTSPQTISKFPPFCWQRIEIENL